MKLLFHLCSLFSLLSLFSFLLLINHQSFVGHGESINEIRTQQLKPFLVVSASKVNTFSSTCLYYPSDILSISILTFGCTFKQDESVRLWNVHTGICILIFAGAGGHRNEVLSVVSIEKMHTYLLLYIATSTLLNLESMC